MAAANAIAKRKSSTCRQLWKPSKNKKNSLVWLLKRNESARRKSSNDMKNLPALLLRRKEGEIKLESRQSRSDCKMSKEQSLALSLTASLTTRL